MRKHTIEFVREKFEKKSCDLLSKEYIDSKTPLEYISPDGYVRTITWDKFKSGRKVCGKARYTVDSLKADFVRKGFIYEGEDRSSGSLKYKYRCPMGHHHSIRIANWQDGVGCPYCNGNAKLTIEFIRIEFKKEGYTLLTTEYKNSSQKLDCITPCGIRYGISWNNWSFGYRYNKNRTRKNLDIIAGNVALFGYTLKSKEYINNKRKLHLICPKGHDYFVSWDNWNKNKSRCTRCSKTGKSIWERTIKQFVKSLGVSFLENDRTLILNPNTNRYVELDLWFPDLNKAIECNSEYWHKERKHIDLIKQKWCESNNVSLLNIDFEDWNKDIKKCQTKIKNFLN